MIVALGLGAGSASAAASPLKGSPVEEETFAVGGSCAALAYLTTDQLRSMIAAGYSDDFHSFCYPEEPATCGDYTTALGGLGRLSTGEDGYHCSFQPAT